VKALLYVMRVAWTGRIAYTAGQFFYTQQMMLLICLDVLAVHQIQATQAVTATEAITNRIVVYTSLMGIRMSSEPMSVAASAGWTSWDSLNGAGSAMIFLLLPAQIG
jgi:hypothetical protein